MKVDIDFLISFMKKYTNPDSFNDEIGEQEDAAAASSTSTSTTGGKNNPTTWSQIVGSKLSRSGPANPISNAKYPDRVKRDGPANQLL